MFVAPGTKQLPPAVAGVQVVLTLMLAEGWPYCARLKRLNASARKMTLFRSVTWKVFSTAESSCQSAGPLRMLRPALPQLPTAGSEKAGGLNQRGGPRLA